MLTVRLALYIFYNTVQSKLDSSHAMRAGDVWIEVASNVHLMKMRSVPLIRCLPKMLPSSSTSTFTDCHLEAILNMNPSRVQLRCSITVDGKDICLTAGISL